MHSFLEMVLSNAVMATLLAVLAAVVSQLCRRPALVHSLWLLVLLKLITPPLLPVPVPWSFEAAGQEESAKLNLEAGATREQMATPETDANEYALFAGLLLEPEESQDSYVAPVHRTPAAESAASPPSVVSWPSWALWLWPAGSLLWLLWTGWHVQHFHRLLRHAQAAPAGLQDRANEQAAKLGLPASPGIWLVPGVVSPMIWAVGRQLRLILPAKLLDRLDREQIAALLLHELAHVRRRDHWVRFLEILTTAVFWWHPVLWWARRELHEAEEQCCDAWVVWALAGAERAYALALLETAAFFSHVRLPLPAAASGIGQVPHLRRRLTMILQARTPRSLSWAGCLVVAGLGFFLLPLVPVQAQETPKNQLVQVADKESVDQQIETLKKAIMILEQQKQAGKSTKPEEKKVDPAALKQAQDVVDQLAKQIEVKRNELRDLETKLRQARARLAALGGKVQFDNAFRVLELQNMVPNIQLAPLDGKVLKNLTIEVPNVDMKALGIQQLDKVLQPGVQVDMAPQPNMIRQYGGKKPAESLEQKLDRLTKEVEELRKEIRKDKPSPYYQPPK